MYVYRLFEGLPKKRRNFFQEILPQWIWLRPRYAKKIARRLKTRLCVRQGRTVRTCVEFFGMKKNKNLHIKIINPVPYIYIFLFFIFFNFFLETTFKNMRRWKKKTYQYISDCVHITQKGLRGFCKKTFKHTPHPPDYRVI